MSDLTCALCGDVIADGYGHNPEPLAHHPERACDRCNQTKVVPTRMARQRPRKQPKRQRAVEPRVPRFPRAIEDPRELPELREALIQLAAPGGGWEASEMQRQMLEACGPGATFDGTTMAGPRGYSPEELPRMSELALKRGQNMTDWYRKLLPSAQLIHVSPDMLDLVAATVDDVPDDLTIEEDDAPAPCGLVTFAKPWYGLDASEAFPGRRIRVDGIMWGQTRLPPNDADWMLTDDFVVPAWSIAAFRFVEPGQADEDNTEPGLPKAIRDMTDTGEIDRPFWLPLGRTDWPHGKPITYHHRPMVDVDSNQWASMMEDRRFLAALWGLINQKRLVERRPVSFDRPALKRLERKGIHGRPQVVVVHLRRTEYVSHPRSGDHAAFTVRWVVRAHPRRQPYGPGRTKRRLIIVPAHIKGPVGAPIIHTERVWELDR